MAVKINSTCPASECSTTFLQGMCDRMAMSFHKYGPVAQAPLDIMPPLDNVQIRIDKYLATGNTEWLMDAANFLMIEFMRPSHKDAHFRATDSKESPGRKWVGEATPNHANNAGGC